MEDDFLVTWGGRYFGWVEDDELFTRDGRHAGRFKGTEVFSTDGGYLGEMRAHRLIVRSDKKHTKRALPFFPLKLRMMPHRVNPQDEPAFELPPGYEDFPPAEML